jgi:hypothetical protein
MVSVATMPGPQPPALRRKPRRAESESPREARTEGQAQIVAAIRRWAELYGGPPQTADWEPSRAARAGEHWRVERFRAGTWPTLNTVRHHFGRFNLAIEAAGLTPNRTPSRIRPHFTGSEQVLSAIREWLRRYGDVPTQADWDPSRARALDQSWRVARFEADDWPSLRSVARHFGSFGNAIRAADLLPRETHETLPALAMRRSENLRRHVVQMSESGGAAGPKGMAIAVRAVADARDSQDPERLHAALLDVAAASLRWAACLPGDGDGGD